MYYVPKDLYIYQNKKINQYINLTIKNLHKLFSLVYLLARNKNIRKRAENELVDGYVRIG